MTDYYIRMLLTCVYTLMDFPHKFFNKLIRISQKSNYFTRDNNKSDSQVTFYEKSVYEINSSHREFNRFRRKYNYREILEHLTYRDGIRYIDYLNLSYPEWKSRLSHFALNDAVGSPRTFKYRGLGRISPTTLRYIAVAHDIDKLFGLERISTVVEIGGGYGGQFSVLQNFKKFSKYQIFDLPEVQELISRYLSGLGVEQAEFPLYPPEDFDTKSIDLVISNYAFSELPSDVQNIYLENICKFAKNGFFLMNSGLNNYSGRSEGKLKLEEIREKIPNLRIAPEDPSTGPDNYLLYWIENTNA